MLRKLSVEFINNHFPEHLNKEEISYGLEVLLAILISNTLLLVTAFLLGYFIEIITFMLCFNLLRVSAGGYHCKSHLTCFLLYYVTGFMDIYIIKLLPSNLYVSTIIFCLLVSMILIYIFAPTQTLNRPIFPKERLRFRRRSIFSFYVVVFGIAIFGALGFWNIALVATIAVLTESLSLINFTKKGGDKHDNDKRKVVNN